MFSKYSISLSGFSLLSAVFAGSVIIRLPGLLGWQPFFGDQAWYFLAARDALFSGRFPLLGITTSITWLHQGPLWTYLLIPVLGLFRFHPAVAAVFITLLNLVQIPLAYYLGAKIKHRRTGLVFSVLLGAYYFSVFHSRLAYHTSPIPLLFIISLLLLLTGRSFLSGLFLGFLFQSHLLTFIYWPIIGMFFNRSPRSTFPGILAGFILGILPFLLSGPVQTLGIFVWLASRLFSGWGSVNLISQAYLVVLLAPLALLSSYISPRLNYASLMVFALIFLLINFTWLLRADYNLSFPQKLRLSDQILNLSATPQPEITTIGPGQEFSSTSLPYVYLIWWRASYSHQSPHGTGSKFAVNEITGQVSVLE